MLDLHARTCARSSSRACSPRWSTRSRAGRSSSLPGTALSDRRAGVGRGRQPGPPRADARRRSAAARSCSASGRRPRDGSRRSDRRWRAAGSPGRSSPTTPPAGRGPQPRTSSRCRCWPTAGRCGARRREPLAGRRGQRARRLLAALAALAFADSPPTGFDADGVLALDGRRSDRLDIRRVGDHSDRRAGPLGGGGGRAARRARRPSGCGRRPPRACSATPRRDAGRGIRARAGAADRPPARAAGGGRAARRPARPGGHEPAHPRATCATCSAPSAPSPGSCGR